MPPVMWHAIRCTMYITLMQTACHSPGMSRPVSSRLSRHGHKQSNTEQVHSSRWHAICCTIYIYNNNKYYKSRATCQACEYTSLLSKSTLDTSDSQTANNSMSMGGPFFSLLSGCRQARFALCFLMSVVGMVSFVLSAPPGGGD